MSCNSLAAIYTVRRTNTFSTQTVALRVSLRVSPHLSSTEYVHHFRKWARVHPNIGKRLLVSTFLYAMQYKVQPFSTAPHSPHHFLPTSGMSDQSVSSCLQVLFEVALKDHEDQTGIALAKHPLAAQLQNRLPRIRYAVLHKQTRVFGEFREVIKSSNYLRIPY